MSLNRFFPLSQTTVIVAAILLLAPSVSAAEWKEKVLYSFQGSPDGSFPGGGVVFDKAGNLYGVTLEGGSGSCPPAQCGIVYQLSPPPQKGGAWTETVLYVFKGQPYGDGSSPSGTLLIDGSGNLYGATGYGGTGNCVLLGTLVGCGTVYELSPPAQKGGAWTETVLYSFPTAKQGYLPNGDLVFDSAGNVYGATMFGGGHGTTCNTFYQYCGAVFELSPPKTKGGKWTEKVLHGFRGGRDGANPNGGLVLDSRDTIYGTTFIGGYNCPHHSGQGCGTVFELDPPTSKDRGWTEKQVHVFKNDADGAQPIAGVILDAAGSLYGAAQGGSNGCGLVFKLTANGGGRWKDTVLYGFGGSQYYYSPAVSQFDESGNLYGTTNVGPGYSLAGSVFRMRPPKRNGGSWTFSLLYGFTGNPGAALPNAGLVFDKTGNLYGTTTEGGSGTGCSFYGCGTVFELRP